MKAALISILLATAAFAEIHQNPGSATPLPHQKYIHVVSEADSPVRQVYIKSKDGMYVGAAIRKPKGESRYPAIIMFHGAPGGRGIEQLAGWSRGDHGGPVWERFLQEGYVVVVADYRGGNMNLMSAPSSNGLITSIDDGLAVIDYVKALPYVDPNRLNLYGVSLGGNLVMNLVSRVQVNSAIVGAPAAIWFLGIPTTPGAPAGPDRFKNVKPDPDVSRKNIEPIRTPVLILVGTADSLLPVTTMLHDALAAAGKPVRMEVYEHGYHDFCLGPQGHNRPDLPQGEALLDSTLDALEKSVQFVKGQKAALPIARMYVFGDSYSDTGAGYVDGDGPTAVGYLASRLGLTMMLPSDSSANGNSINFAVSGAQTGHGAGRKVKDALLGRGMEEQVEDFAARVRSKAIVFDPDHTLFFFAGGLNDRRLPGTETVSNLKGEIRKLYDLGARRFRVALLPTAIPAFSEVGLRLNPELQRIPAEIESELRGARVSLSHWGTFFDDVMRNPSEYGIENTKDACAGRAIFDENATPCAKPSAYYYYHAGHPSTAVHKVVGDKMYAEINSH
jgi:dienelactone hydrolase/phospholipase/lecithinase/hemolysin